MGHKTFGVLVPLLIITVNSNNYSSGQTLEVAYRGCRTGKSKSALLRIQTNTDRRLC